MTRARPVAAALALLLLAACAQPQTDIRQAPQAQTVAPPAEPAQAGAADLPPPAETRATNAARHAPAFPGQTRAPNLAAKVDFRVTEIATGLSFPFSVEPLPGGGYLVAERSGALRLVSAAGVVSPPVTGLPASQFNAQGGLLDLALDPAFADNRLVYWSYTEDAGAEGNRTSVARGRLEPGDQPSLSRVEVIFRQSPALRSPLHFGARLVFDRTGALFVGLGERSIGEGRRQAQDLASHLGKVVRIRPDGSVPADNPHVGKPGAKPEIWSAGHRNIQGAFLHPATGELWTMEHGPQGGDELNIARAGRDYGWPTITYGVEYGPVLRRIGEGRTQADGLEQPLYYWDPVIAPGAMIHYDAALFPAWRGSVFVSGLNTSRIARLTMDGETVRGEEWLTFSPRRERYRDLAVDADGALLVLTDGPAGRLLKVTPAG